MQQAVAQDRLLESLFRAIDAKDSAHFVSFLTEDCAFRFGSAPAVRGRDAVAEAVDAFFASIDGLRHVVQRTWTGNGTLACEGEVTYRRHDGSEITLPFADVFEFSGELISSYCIYIDIAPLYAD